MSDGSRAAQTGVGNAVGGRHAMSTEERGEGRRAPRHAAEPWTGFLPEPGGDPYRPDDPYRPGDPYASTFPDPALSVPESTGPVPVAPSARAQLVPASDLPDLPGPRAAPDDAARRRRRAEETVRALQVSESRLTDQIRAARAAGRTDGMRELLSRRLAVRARLGEARTRV